MVSHEHTYELVTEPSDGVEITWQGTYYWSTPRPATYLDPPEGGLEMESDIRPIGVIYSPIEGEGVVIQEIEDGSILHHLLAGKYDDPSEEDQMIAAFTANHDRMEDPRW